MEQIHNLQKRIEPLTKNLPHLPKAGSSWLAQNVWWITLVGAIIGTLAALQSINTYISVTSSWIGRYVMASPGLHTASYWIGIVFLAAIIIVSFLAVQPLKEQKRRGWDLLFISALISAASAAVSLVLTFNIGSLILTAIGVAIGLYLLYEIYPNFTKKKTESKK